MTTDNHNPTSPERFSPKSSRGKWYLWAGIATLAIPLVVYARSQVGGYGLYVFEPNTKVLSSEVNDNFEILGEHMAVYEDAITVDGDGNVGIGMTDPWGSLHINHPPNMLTPIIVGSMADWTSPTAIYLRTLTTAYIGTGGTAGDIRIVAGEFVSSNPDGITVRNSGNVGIGTTSPQYALDVVGQVRADNVEVTSDLRLKTDIASLANALEGVQCLEGVTYRWRDPDKSQDLQIGLVAQEVEACFPEVVSTDERGYKSVAYARLVAPLAEAVKEQQGMISQQKQVITAQQAQLSEQQQKIARLEAEQRNITARLARLEASLNAG